MADMPVQIVEYDARWQEKFAQQRDLLSPALSRWLAAPIEHVGSTSVTGLASKPIIDILAPVTSLADAQGAVPLLQAAGWLFWPTDPNRSWRLWFLRPRPEARTHHLHLIEHDDPHSQELRIFRDLLRSQPELRQRYELLKYELAQTHRDDREAYSAAKRHFVKTALRGARD
ncbi:GrpB family protein [Mycobacterium sp.]|uniref:GrpB family protein n=1 Tax=Mycobacterium sp. TaxID=1785 RepID=UPI002D900A75|nr:GrpB family protein [Mycobacterium sp.]